jgi:hypothetical protein
MKKFVFVIIIVLTICIIPFMLSAGALSAGEKKDLELTAAAADNGNTCAVFYVANNQLDSSRFLRVTELSGYVSPADLADIGGKYILQKLMTYKDCCDLGLTDGISYDVDPNRMVWVIQTYYDETDNMFNFEGSNIRNVTATSIWDAETGDAMSMMIQSDDPSFKDAIAKSRPTLTN